MNESEEKYKRGLTHIELARQNLIQRIACHSRNKRRVRRPLCNRPDGSQVSFADLEKVFNLMRRGGVHLESRPRVGERFVPLTFPEVQALIGDVEEAVKKIIRIQSKWILEMRHQCVHFVKRGSSKKAVNVENPKNWNWILAYARDYRGGGKP